MVCRCMAVWLIVFSGISSGDPTLPGDSEFEEMVAEFGEVLEDLREIHGFPGATAAFMLRDGRIGSASAGLSDLESEIPMEADDRMFSGSVGKTFVAALALTMVGEGMLSLDAPITTWLGDEPWFNKLENGSAITLRQLLTHSSGIRDHLHEAGFAFALNQRVAAGRVDDPFEPAELVRYVLRKEPHFAPGEGFHYTDTGYILVGLIIEEVSGETYYSLLRRAFLDPLRLSRTSPSVGRRIPGLIPGYLDPRNAFGLPERSMVETGLLVIDPATEWTGGGLVTNSQDLVRWGMSLYHDKVLGQELTAAMFGSAVVAGNGPTPPRYGFGVFLIDTPLGMTYGHGGYYPGYNSQLAYFPERELAIAIQVNRDYDNPRLDYIQALAGPLCRMLAQSEAP